MTECLPCAKHCSEDLECGDQDPENAYPLRAYILVGKSAYSTGAISLYGCRDVLLFHWALCHIYCSIGFDNLHIKFFTCYSLLNRT